MPGSKNSPSFRNLLALIPIGFSLAALTVTTIAIAANGVVREGDEGAVAHLCQLFMTASFILAIAFGIRWLGRSACQALRILMIQIFAALLAVAPVAYFKL